MREYNGVMLQFFHWYTQADGKLWEKLKKEAQLMADKGITSVWLPPAYKGVGGSKDVGYGVYDLFDLGEFDQKGTVRTKYGTRKEYIDAINAAQQSGLQVYADVVFNHKLGADYPEEFKATPFDPNNRNNPLGEMQTIKAWTHFTFPGRKNKYSELHWHWWHFNATDYNALDEDVNAVFLFDGKIFNDNVDKEKGNFDYLMGCNLDMNNPDVIAELLHWGKWYLETTGVDGFRFDAVKHVKSGFFIEWLNEMRNYSDKNLFCVGEYWSDDIEALKKFVSETKESIMLFDAGLHYNFARAGKEGRGFDLQHIFDNTLVQEVPSMAVTLVSNHDTQPLQALESVVEAWFKPLAYAIILLRRDGYPCIFGADYYGAGYRDVGKDGNEYDIEMPSHQWIIDRFLEVRMHYAFGEQHDYFDHPDCIGWTRTGDEEYPGGMAVLLSNGDEGLKSMKTGSPDAAYVDVTAHVDEMVTTNKEGWAEFKCKPGSVSVWVPKK
jgi:alpha-amylase